jgi:hypothetical protein
MLKRIVAVQPQTPPEKVPVIVLPRDRPYDEEELRTFKIALTYNIDMCPPMKPIPGNLAYYLRNVDNEAAISILKAGMRRRGFDKRYEDVEQVRVILIKFVEYYNKLDGGSQQRPDVFDYLCITLGVNPLDIWEIFRVEAEQHSKEMVKHDIEIQTPYVVNAIARKALKDNDVDAKKLFARIAGLDKDTPTVVFQDNSTTNNTQVNNNQNIFTNFSASIRKSEVELDKANEPRQLEAGEQSYINAEYSTVEEREKVA